MSGLVNGLQNRLRRFESARHLTKRESQKQRFSFFRIYPRLFVRAHEERPLFCHFSIDLYQKDDKKTDF